ncbi:phosphatidylinositol-4,5-bisphosphate 4-phosphatase, partial [Paragonimus westermani]
VGCPQMDEKTPLISAGKSRVEPVHSGNVVAHAETNYIDNQATINCHVCNHVVSIENREKQLVVRCPNCSEATPIKGPPAGKQYVRCPCNCLLVCSTKTTRVGCPRPECQKVIVLHEVRCTFFELMFSKLILTHCFPRLSPIQVSECP